MDDSFTPTASENWREFLYSCSTWQLYRHCAIRCSTMVRLRSIYPVPGCPPKCK